MTGNDFWKKSFTKFNILFEKVTVTTYFSSIRIFVDFFHIFFEHLAVNVWKFPSLVMSQLLVSKKRQKEQG